MLTTLPLFDSVPRKAQRDRAHANADPNVLRRYEQVMRILGLNTFVAAEVTAAYESRYGKLAESDAKGLGGLYADLQRRGVISKTGQWRRRKNGNASLEYRFNR